MQMSTCSQCGWYKLLHRFANDGHTRLRRGESAELVGGGGQGAGGQGGPTRSGEKGSSRGPGYLLARDHAQCK